MHPYLVESNEGFVRPWLLSSHTLLANSFPIDDITLISSMGQSSRSRDRTLERWVPRFRWIPEHSMHMRAPKFKLAQLGSTEREKGKFQSDRHHSFSMVLDSQGHLLRQSVPTVTCFRAVLGCQGKHGKLWAAVQIQSFSELVFIWTEMPLLIL